MHTSCSVILCIFILWVRKSFKGLFCIYFFIYLLVCLLVFFLYYVYSTHPSNSRIEQNPSSKKKRKNVQTKLQIRTQLLHVLFVFFLSSKILYSSFFIQFRFKRAKKKIVQSPLENMLDFGGKMLKNKKKKIMLIETDRIHR